MAIKIFFCYAHEDELLLNKLKAHLRPLQRQGLIDIWYDRDISAGTEWEREISEQLNTAQIILLLVSPDFMDSDYCYSKEMQKAMERDGGGEARVIPVLIRPVIWQNAPFSKIQVLPSNAKPITNWRNRDQAFLDIVQGIEQTAKAWLTKPSISSQLPEQIHDMTNLGIKYQGWDEAPSTPIFFGRTEELTALEQWVVQEQCRLLAVLGIGGVGKTALAVKLVEQIKDEFQFVFWRSLQNAPPLEGILKSCIQFLSNQQRIDLPEDIDGQMALLLQHLREKRCLLVLDNIETILQAGDHAGQYRVEYAEYGRLLRRLGEAKHQSCILLTGREKPKEIALFEGKTSPVRSLLLSGLEQKEGQELLRDKGLFGSDKTWSDLIRLYAGNPLNLKLVSEPIEVLFGGDIALFLKRGKTAFGDIREPLDLQFTRLSDLEREIMYWLAIEREAVSLDDLRENMVFPLSEGDLLVAVGSLRRRSMIETSGTACFTLQPVIMEYVTDRFVERISEEIETQTIGLFGSHALMKAQAKDYVRESQIRLILVPVAGRLLSNVGKDGIEKKLKNILSALRETHSQKSNYAAGNVLNLLVHLKSDLRGYDLSDLVVKQAYLRRVPLPDVNFTHAQFETSLFTEIFGAIHVVKLSPDGRLLAAGTAAGEIRLWHMSNGAPFLTLQGHTAVVRSIAFNPEGNVLASGSDDRTVQLWDIHTGQCLHILQGHSNLVRAVAYSPDGRMLVSGSEDGTIRFWDANTGQFLMLLQGDCSWVMSIAFSPDGSILASGGSENVVRLWEVDTGQCIQTFHGHTNSVRAVAFSPGGSMLASGGEDRTIRFWEINTGQCLQTLLGHNGRIRAVAFSPDGSMLASGGEDRTIRIWDVNTGNGLDILLGHTVRVWSVIFSLDGKTIISGSEDQSIRFWEVNTGYCSRILQGYNFCVWSIAFQPKRNILACVGEDQFIRLWDADTGKCLQILKGHDSIVKAVAFNSDGNILASGSEDQSIRFWEINTGHCSRILRGYNFRTWSIAFHPKWNILASTSEDQLIRLWDMTTGQCLQTFHGHTHRIYAVAFSSDGRTLASGGDDQSIKLWDITTGQHLHTIQEHAHRIYAVAFSSDGRTLASGGEDSAIRLWNIKTGQCLQTLHGHSGWIRSLAFNSNGSLLASGSDDYSVRLWDIGRDQCLHILQGHRNLIRAVTFNHNGSIVASGSEDGTIRIWKVQSGEFLRLLQSERLCECMDISGVKGLTDAQKATLRILGASDDERRAAV